MNKSEKIKNDIKMNNEQLEVWKWYILMIILN